MSIEQSIEHIYQLPIDIRILIACSNSAVGTQMYIYDPEFRKYAVTPSFIQLFKQLVSIKPVNKKFSYGLNNRTLITNETGSDKNQQWYLNGKLHRRDKPAVVTYKSREYYLYGKLHRIGGPAVLGPDGYKAYFVHGKLHRDNGPAIIS
jgi:hypothetical protein